MTKQLFILLFLFSTSQVYRAASSEEIENINPTPNSSLPITNPIIVEKEKPISQKIYDSQDTIPPSSLELRGKIIEKEKLESLKNPHNTEINLYMISGKERGYFLENDCISVSPEIINPSVKILSLIICGLRDQNINDIGKFSDLENLNLSTNSITNVGAKNIIALKKLRILNLHSNKIGNTFLQNLAATNTVLEELDVSSNNQITDEGIEHIIEMPSLKKLRIMGNKISREMYQKIKREKPKLQVEYFPG